MYSIIIDRRSAQWEDFDHELGHLLRHYGNQLNMPEAFVCLQESQAKSEATLFGDTKTYNSIRKIVIGKSLVNDLLKHKKRQNENKLVPNV